MSSYVCKECGWKECHALEKLNPTCNKEQKWKEIGNVYR